MRRIEILVILILFVLLLALGAVYGRDLLSPPQVATPTSIYQEMGVVPVSPVPLDTLPPTLEATATPSPTPAPQRVAQRLTTPTPEAGGRVLALTPAAGDVGWWGSEQNRRANIGDSFLYAGRYESQVFVAAARWDISRIPRGAPIREAIVTLTGLRGDRLHREAGGIWTVQLLAGEKLSEWGRNDFQAIFNAAADITLFPVLEAEQLGENEPNQWRLDGDNLRWLEQQVVDESGYLVLRILGPVGGADTLFAWDSGAGPATGGNGPQLLLNLGPAPATPPPTPTKELIIATLTPTPENVLTVAVQAEIATIIATAIGTYTPTPDNVVTPTPFPANLETVQAIAFAQNLPPVILHTPTPASQETADALGRYATAVALTTGTFTPVPTGYVTPELIYPSPPAANVATAAARLWTATAEAAGNRATPTPLPYNAVMAQYLYATATPENVETVLARAFNATAIAVTTGTATPLPWNVVVLDPPPVASTAGPTPTRLVVFLDQLTPTPTPFPTATPPSVMPPELVGKILFWSNREGGNRLYSFDPVSGRIARLADRWPYDLALQGEARSPFGNYRLVVREDDRRIPQVFVYDEQYNVDRNLSQTASWAYDAVWSPRGDRIAYVSQEPGNDEIYVTAPDGAEKLRLTYNGWEWDKHPTWSPDGSQIVFYSNRDVGRRQLWIMDVDGSNQRRLIESTAEDWDPVWVK